MGIVVEHEEKGCDVERVPMCDAILSSSIESGTPYRRNSLENGRHDAD
ncbi:MAG TPA: hypothetical protein VE223_06870 [Nitrososphaeraceae archaeon]|jgi:hypothetical protein|nr:hypothetical protein [Nitrososphaeraceae archaeon]